MSQQDFSLAINTNEVSNRQQRTWAPKAPTIAFNPAFPILFQDTGIFAKGIAHQNRPKALQLTRNGSQGANGKCSYSGDTPIIEKFLQLIFFKIRLPTMQLATASAPSGPAELLERLMSSRAKSFRTSLEEIAFIIAWYTRQKQEPEGRAESEERAAACLISTSAVTSQNKWRGKTRKQKEIEAADRNSGAGGQ